MDQIAYWMGVPITELPRAELEQALIDTFRELQAAQEAMHRSSVAYIHDLAAMARSR